MCEIGSGISRVEFEQRRDLVRQHLLDRQLSAAVIVGRSFYDRCGSLAYLTGHFPPFPASVFSGSVRGVGHSILVLPVDRDPILLVDGFYREDLVSIDDVRPNLDLVSALACAVQELHLEGNVLGLGGEDILPLAFYRDLKVLCSRMEFQSIDEHLGRLRAVKSPAEQSLLRTAAQVAEVGLKAAIESIRPGATEQAVCAAGLEAATAAGADFVRYLRVHSGPWSAKASRWPPAMSRELQPGELVLLDIIGAVGGYQFDVLRTAAVGEPNEEQRRMVEAVRTTVDSLVAAARPGVKASELAALGKRLLGEAGFAANAGKFIGHGIGLETVEDPYLLPGSAGEILPGMVLCLEPAIWIDGIGGCSIEQEVIVHDDYTELITLSPTVLW